MAMQNSAALPNDVTKEASSVSKEDLTSLDAGKEQQGGDDAAQDRKEEETLASEKTQGAADPEGVFVDAESVADVNSVPQGVVDRKPLDVRNTFEVAEDEDVMEDENGSVESYDSALERIAVDSTGDPASPEVPSSPLFQAAETPQQIALRQLNMWHSGIFSLDSTLLDNVTPAEFRNRITEIAQSQGLSSDSEDVEHVFSALLPLVEENESQEVESETEGELKGANNVSAGNESKDGGDNVDGSGQEVTSSNYDSTLEPIAAASTDDPASPEVPSSPLFQPAETPQQIALRKLNMWHSGISSLDSTLLENVSPAEFRNCVAQIAQSQGLSSDSEDVEHVLSGLLPLVEAKESQEIEGETEGELKRANNVSAGDESKDGGDIVDGRGQEVTSSKADSKVDDGGQNAEENTKDVSASLAEANGNIDIEQSDASDTHPVEVLQDEKVENSGLNDEALTTMPNNISEHSFPEDSLKENMRNTKIGSAEGSSGDGATGPQFSENENYEPEPELTEWDGLNESGADDLGNSNADNPPAEDIESKETEDLDSVVVAGLQRENENQEDSKSSVMEDEDRGANLSPRNAVVDSAQEQKEESIGGHEAFKAETPKEDPAEPDDKPVGIKEVSGDATVGSTGAADDVKEASADDAGTNLEFDENPPLDVVAEREDNKATPKELGADGKAETSEPGFMESEEQVNARANNFKGTEEETLEGTAVDATQVNEGHGIEEPSAAETSKSEDNETLERKLTQENNDLVKKEDSPSHETTPDVSAKTQEAATAPAMAADAASTEEKNKQSPPINVSAKGEDSEKEISSSVDTKASTAPANDSASSLGGAGPSLPVRPAGLGRSVPSLEHAPRAVQRSGGTSASTQQASESNEENQSSTDVTEGNEDAREKLQMIRVKFLRLAHRLGQSAHNVVVAQVLYRLGLAEQLRGGRGSGRSGAFSFERASVLAEEQEAAGVDDLEFGCTIMVLGKSGVGKSATINSLFDEIKSGTNAYSPATNKVQEIVGTVHGIKLRVIDTPGLLTSFTDQRRNEMIMSSVKRFIKKSPPDIVLYFDRLDMQSRDYGDLPLLRTITDTFGSAVWFNAIVVLTHASSAPPDGANGVPVSYEMFVAQRSHVVQQTIRQAAGDMRLMNPVSLVENHAACRRNRAGERVLPNGQVWKPQLLLLCFASKILAEANSLLKLQDSTPAKPFGVRSRVPPLPFLLSSLLQSRAQLKLPDEQVGTDDDETEDESDDEAESEGEEYDDLPPFRRLTREELKLLDKEQRRTYAEELEYREKLFMKKQLKDEKARKKELKRRLAALPKEAVQYIEDNFEEENASASVPVPMPDMALPPSFDSDNPTYRYRYLDAANQWLVRPVLETHGWDHDSGYDGLNVEKMFVVSKKIPVSVSGQVTKDKKEATLQMECAASFKNGEGKVTQAGLDIQTIGKDLAYTLRSETRFDNFKRNKTTCGLAVTLLGDTVAAGMKIEDRLQIGKRVKLVFNGGALTGRGDVAYGGSLEATIRDKDYPLGSFLSTFGLSVMDWHGDLAIGGNLQVQCKLGKTMTIVRGNLNNRRAGQVSIRVSSSEQLQIALIGLIPLLRTFINNKVLSSN